MRKTRVPVSLTGAIALWLVLASQAILAAVYQGQVVAVIDGDTIDVRTAHKTLRVRLAEIDAPERRQAFGNRAKQSLSELIFGKTVRVVEEDIDRYGRLVGRVYAGAEDINAAQVRRGMAWAYTRYSRDPLMIALEWLARLGKHGLWQDPRPVPPWKYRHGQR
jgi:endonuclease YncB( thermonuclease family)